MVDIEYANAYTEVLEILSYISREDYNKIPQEEIDLFKTNCNKEYDFKYDMNKTLTEQKVSKIARIIIAILYRDYWATDIQKEKIKAREEYDKKIREQKTREKYNPDNIFNKKQEKDKNSIKENTEMVVYKQSFMRKFLEKIIKWFKRK